MAEEDLGEWVQRSLSMEPLRICGVGRGHKNLFKVTLQLSAIPSDRELLAMLNFLKCYSGKRIPEDEGAIDREGTAFTCGENDHAWRTDFQTSLPEVS